MPTYNNYNLVLKIDTHTGADKVAGLSETKYRYQIGAPSTHSVDLHTCTTCHIFSTLCTECGVCMFGYRRYQKLDLTHENMILFRHHSEVVVMMKTIGNEQRKIGDMPNRVMYCMTPNIA